MAITPETLIELIENTISTRMERADEIRNLRQECERLEMKLEELQQEEQGYRLALARRFPDVAGMSVPVSSPTPSAQAGLFALPDDLVTQSRSDAVEAAIRVLTRTASVASPAAIEEFLRSRGRDDTRDAIGAALAYLNRTDRVKNVGRGQWRLKESR